MVTFQMVTINYWLYIIEYYTTPLHTFK